MGLAIQYYFLMHYLFWVPVLFKEIRKRWKFYLLLGISTGIIGFLWEAICIYLGYWEYYSGIRILGVPLCVVAGYFIYICAVYTIAKKAVKK